MLPLSARAFVAATAVASAFVLAACNADAPSAPASTADSALVERTEAIDAAIAEWASATTIEQAHAAAEEARNLVVGPAGPLFGDANGDGTVEGDSGIGLLPGLGGETGLAQAEPVNACVEQHVLGGSWDDPAERWEIALTAYDEWAPSNNTFPSLPSHPQRVVGWATNTLATTDLDEAHEYASHARIHGDLTTDSISDCNA